MIRRPALRLATLPLPPGFFAARFLAAAIRPPRDFFIPCLLCARCGSACGDRLVDEAEDAIDAFLQALDRGRVRQAEESRRVEAFSGRDGNRHFLQERFRELATALDAGRRKEIGDVRE